MKLLWDFFGPHAQRTATHFEKHLTEFLTANGHPQLQRGTESSGEGHQAVYCVTPPELVDVLRKALRPNRAL